METEKKEVIVRQTSKNIGSINTNYNTLLQYNHNEIYIFQYQDNAVYTYVRFNKNLMQVTKINPSKVVIFSYPILHLHTIVLVNTCKCINISKYIAYSAQDLINEVIK